MGISRAYLDAYYLLEVVFKGVNRSQTERLLSQISTGSYEVFIPQIVVGETVSQMYEKCGGRTRPDHLLERFASLMEKYGWGDANMTPPSNKSFRMAAELTRMDNRLVGVDVELLSIALADPDSKFLFTLDNMLAGNKSICDYELKLRHDRERNTRLKILTRL